MSKLKPTPASERPISIRAVAAACGVSAGTVSRVLNKRLGVMRVPLATREHIEKTAERLGYVPNIHAKRVFGRRTGVLGFVVPSFERMGTHAFENLHLTRLLTGMEAELSGRSERLLLIFDDARFIREKQYLSLCRERSVDGLFIWGAGEMDLHWAEFVAEGWPHLFLGNLPPENIKGHFLVNDDEGAAHAVATGLLTRGARNLAWIGGKEGISVTRQQLAGIRRAMGAFGLNEGPFPVIYGDYHETSGMRAAGELASAHRHIDGLLCANGNVAQGAVSVMASVGWRAEIGCCDACAGMERNRGWLRAEPRDLEMGRLAVRILLELVEGTLTTAARFHEFDLHHAAARSDAEPD